MGQLRDERPASFGALLRDFRLAAGLSQEALAERARMSPGGISVLERGARRAPYRDTIALLADALGLASEDRRRLEVAAARPTQPRRRHGPSGETDQPPAHNLPLELTSFIGREAELGRLRSLLETSRLVTIAGPGGVGKTRVALRIAETLVGMLGGGVWFVDLAPLTDGAAIASVIAQALGMPLSPSGATREALLGFVARSDLVVVLDNCEHVLGDAAQISAELLRAGPGVRILATSREPLKTTGERVFRLPPLPPQDAVALFVSRAEAVDQRFALSAQSAQVVGSICSRLDGIPLAIELAAARSSSMPFATLAENLHRRLSPPAVGGARAVSRHQTLRALIDWSYDLLAPSAQRIFERLSVFVGGATLALAARVCGETGDDVDAVLDELTALVDKSLVVPDFDHEEPRYTLLESIRHYAREQLVRRGESAETVRRHALALVELAETYCREWEVTRPSNWLDSFGVEMDNWRSVLEWALLAQEDIALGGHLVWALHPAWVSIAVAEGVRWLRTAREAHDGRIPPLVLAELDHVEAKISQRAGETALSLDAARRAFGVFREVGDVRRTIDAQRMVADQLIALDRPAEAEPELEEALATARRAGFPWLVARVFLSFGRLSSLTRRFDEARNHFRAARAALKEIGDVDGVRVATVNLAEAEFRAGDAATALGLVEGVIAEPGARRMPEHVANIAAYLVALNRFDEALVRAREVLAVARESQHHSRFVWNLHHYLAAATLRLAVPDATTSPLYRDVARVLGFLDAEVAAIGTTREFTEQQEYDRIVTRLHDALEPADLARCMNAGAMLSGADAIAVVDALSANAPPGHPAP